MTWATSGSEVGDLVSLACRKTELIKTLIKSKFCIRLICTITSNTSQKLLFWISTTHMTYIIAAFLTEAFISTYWCHRMWHTALDSLLKCPVKLAKNFIFTALQSSTCFQAVSSTFLCLTSLLGVRGKPTLKHWNLQNSVHPCAAALK